MCAAKLSMNGACEKVVQEVYILPAPVGTEAREDESVLVFL